MGINICYMEKACRIKETEIESQGVGLEDEGVDTCCKGKTCRIKETEIESQRVRLKDRGS
jgi:hypothetical protein